MYAIAKKTVVSLYTAPKKNEELDDELLYGMKVELLETVPDAETGEEIWAKVKTEYNLTDYCLLENLETDEARVNAWTTPELKVVYKRYADILSLPKVQGVFMESVTRGGRIKVVGADAENPAWVKVELTDGRIGYTKESYLGPYYDKPFTDNEDEFRARLVEMAKGYMGTQYRWGGKSSLGIDCSGMTSMSYMLCGKLIYRNSAFNPDFGTRAITLDEIKPGDLLHFPGHIAMYIGDDHYIHSTGKDGSDGVVINSLNPSHEDYREDLPAKITHISTIF